jgi:hypothetical protein
MGGGGMVGQERPITLVSALVIIVSTKVPLRNVVHEVGLVAIRIVVRFRGAVGVSPMIGTLERGSGLPRCPERFKKGSLFSVMYKLAL